MADPKEVDLDRAQVKKAAQALLAYIKSRSTKGRLLMDEPQPINLLFTLWKIPKEGQTIRIPLPYGQKNETEETEVCLFTRDEPKMTSDQTQRFYKKLLEVKGVENIAEVIPYSVLKTEYKSYEAKRRLLGNFDLFLSDERIKRLLPSHIGRHFYDRKKEPLGVDLESKHLARDIKRIIQGTKLKVTKKGCCCMVRVGHAGMTADELTENIEASVQTAASKIRVDGPVLKIVHLKSMKSVSLPIYTSDLHHMDSLLKTPEEAQKEAEVAALKEAKKRKKSDKKKTASPVKEEEIKGEEAEEGEEEEEIPELVPIATPNKKPKREKPSKKIKEEEQQQLEKAPKSPTAKKDKKAPKKLTKKAGKTDSKTKRKVPKVK